MPPPNDNSAITKQTSLLLEISLQSVLLLKKNVNEISFEDMCAYIKLALQLLRESDKSHAQMAQVIAANMWQFLSDLKLSEKQKHLLACALKYETLQSFILEGASHTMPELPAGNLNDLSTEALTTLTGSLSASIELAKSSTIAQSDQEDSIAAELLCYIGMTVLACALISLTIEIFAGTGVVISMGAISLAIEHIISGLLVIGASSMAVGAVVHYAYAPIEKPIMENNAIGQVPALK